MVVAQTGFTNQGITWGSLRDPSLQHTPHVTEIVSIRNAESGLTMANAERQSCNQMFGNEAILRELCENLLHAQPTIPSSIL